MRWLLAVLSVGVVISGALVAVPAQAAGAVNTDDYRPLINVGSGKCIDLRDGSSADWTPVQQWTCVGHPNMEWALDIVGPGSFTLSNRRTEYHSCLDVEWGSHDDGAPLQGFHCTSDNLAQMFYQG